MRIRCPQLDLFPVQEPGKVSPFGMKGRVVKLGPHGASDHLWVPEINRSRQGDRRCGAKSSRRPKYGSDVSGILHGVEHEDAAHRGHVECIQRAGWNFANRDYALRRFRLGRAAEILLGNFRDFNARVIELFSQGFASRGGSQLRGNERAANREAGAQQLFDRAYAFGDEKRVFFACLSPVKIARKCK